VGESLQREVVASLRDSRLITILSRHFRAGLSHAAASRLDYGRFLVCWIMGSS